MTAANGASLVSLFGELATFKHWYPQGAEIIRAHAAGVDDHFLALFRCGPAFNPEVGTGNRQCQRQSRSRSGGLYAGKSLESLQRILKERDLLTVLAIFRPLKVRGSS